MRIDVVEARVTRRQYDIIPFGGYTLDQVVELLRNVRTTVTPDQGRLEFNGLTIAILNGVPGEETATSVAAHLPIDPDPQLI